jgi:hypothetical protein
MAVLAQNVQRPCRLPVAGVRTAEVKLAGYTNFDTGNKNNEVFSGSVVIQDVSDTDGYSRAAPASASVNAASGDFFMGLALEHVLVDSSSLTDGLKKVTVARDGVWGFPVGAVAQTDIGAPAYTSDDGQTVTTTSTNNWWIGDIEDIDATYVWVNIARAFNRPTSAA